MIVDRQCSFARFVHAFTFDPARFDALCDATGQAALQRPAEAPSDPPSQQPWWSPLKLPTDDLLRHVADYLNCPDRPTARAWELTPQARDGTAGLGAQADWALLTSHQSDPGLPFRWRAVQLVLFRSGVGFLTLGADPIADQPEAWWDLGHYFRFANRADVRLRAQRSIGRGQTEPFFPALGGREVPPDKRCVARLIEGLLATVDPDSWWAEIYVPGQLLSYVVWFLDEVPEDDDLRLAYRLRHGFHARQHLIPAAADLALDQPGLVPYAARQWQVCTLAGGGFLACDAPHTPFFRGTLTDHLRNAYYFLFLLALQQRFTLMSLSQEVAAHGLTGDGEAAERLQEEAFERLCARLREFTARGYFRQAMQREHHHRAYQRWLAAFEVPELYDEVRNEALDLQAASQARRQQRQERAASQLQHRISLLSATIGVPALLLGFLGINLRDVTAGQDGLWWGWAVLLTVGLGGLLGWLVLRYLTRLDRPPDPPHTDR